MGGVQVKQLQASGGLLLGESCQSKNPYGVLPATEAHLLLNIQGFDRQLVM